MDRGGEYYGRYTKDGQAPGPFAKFLQKHGIVALYTMSGSPPQNGVAERRNRTLKDIVRSMRRNSKLPESFVTEALKMTVYILNRVPTNVVLKMSKGYRFYCPSHNTNIVESRNAKFLENDLINHIDAQPSTSSDRLIVIYNAPQVQTSDGQPIIEVPQTANDNPESTKARKTTLPGDYVVYLQESDYNIRAKNDPEMFSQVISCKESKLWYDAMKDEMNYMTSNEVWNFVKLPDGAEAIGCKWVFKKKNRFIGQH
ncbi:hypothetical protein AAG906_035595 [Vitis piasezkii]